MKAFTRWGAIALVAFAAACDNAAGPEVDETFDARAAVDDYAALEGILSTADWQGLGVIAKAAPSGVPARIGGGAAGPAGAPIISDLSRGATFVYDAVAGDWVKDPDRDGAPSNGVRFIVYEEVGGVPDPSRERGFADLIDEGDNSVDDVVLRLQVTEEGEMTMDYGLQVDETAGRGFVRAQGFVRGDDGRLDFDVALEGSEAGPNEIVFDLAVEERDFGVRGNLIGSDHSDDGEVHISAEHRANTLALDFVAEAGQVSGGVELDDAAFVLVSGTPDDPQFTRPDGSPLRAIEVLALLRIVDLAEDVFDLVEDLVDPVQDIVILGLIL
jgi:hypothetical protein